LPIVNVIIKEVFYHDDDQMLADFDDDALPNSFINLNVNLKGRVGAPGWD
jgi:hypothetical protein